MSSKMNQIPFLSSYEDVRAEMNRDLQYRLNSRTARTSLGRPPPALLSHQCSDDYDAGVPVLLPVLLGAAEPDVWRQ